MNFIAIIFDVLIIAVLLIFALRGKKKGLVLTLFGLIAFFVAILGANYLSARFEPAAVQYLTPKLEVVLTDQFSQEVEKEQEASPELTLDELPVSGMMIDVLTNFGLLEDLANDIAKSVQETTQKTVESIAKAMAAALAQLIAKSLLFFLFFAAILLIWFILSHILDLAFKLPGLRAVNGIGGFICGALKGLIIIWVIVAALFAWSGLISAETIGDSFVLRFFVEKNPLSIFMKG